MNEEQVNYRKSLVTSGGWMSGRRQLGFTEMQNLGKWEFGRREGVEMPK